MSFLSKISRIPKLLWARILALPGFVWRTLWVCYFIVAIVVISVRYVVLPQVANERERIEDFLSAQVGLPVKISSVKAEWAGLHPSLELLSLRVMDQSKRQALELPRVDAVLGWSSLWRMRPILSRLEIHKPQLEIRREADGSIYVAGIRVKGGAGNASGEENGFSDFILHQGQILIRDAKVSWTDAKRGAPTLSLDKLNLRLDNKYDRHRFAILASPPSQWSDPLDIRGDLRGEKLSAPESWRGTVYLEVANADLAAWKRWVDYPVALDHGRASLRSWLNVEGPKVFGVTADVALANISAQLGDDLPAFNVNTLSGRIRASMRDGDLTVEGERLTMLTGEGGRVEPTSFFLRSHAARGKQPASVELGTGRLDLGLVAKTAARLPLPASIKEPLQQLQPRGRLDNLKLSWKSIPDAPQQFRIDAKFAQVGVDAGEKFPGMQGLSGQITGDDREGTFRLNVRNGVFAYPDVMFEDIRLDQAAIEGGWKHERVQGQEAESLNVYLNKLQLSNPDLRGEFAGFWRSASDGPGYLDLHGTAQHVRVNSAIHYLPRITPQDTVNWLTQGLRGGQLDNVVLQTAGNLQDFPYRKGGGIFKVGGQMVDAEVMFADGWLGMTNLRGSLLFEGARMLIVASSGRYQGVTASNVRVEIPDMVEHEKQILLVDGKAKGPTTDFLHYVNNSHIAHLAGNFTRGITARGSGELGLHLEVPLYNANDTKVRGEYRILSNQVKLISVLPEFYDTNGTLTFTEKGLGLRGAEASFAGRHVSASGTTDADGTLRFEAEGAVSSEGLRQIARLPVWDYVRGESMAHATIKVKAKSVDVNVSSDLAGMTSSFPAPMQKPAEQAWPLVFNWHSDGMDDGSSTERWQVQVNKRMNLVWEDRCTTRCSFARGLFAYGTQVDLPARGWRLAGDFAHLDVEPWRPVVSHLAAGDGASPDGGQSSLAGLAFKADELDVGGHRFHNVTARAVRQDGNWTLQTEGPQLEGSLVWTDGGRGRLSARLKRLVLEPVPAADDATAPASSSAVQSNGISELPALDVVADEFYLRKLSLGRLQLSAVNADKLWMLQKISLNSPDFHLEGQGQWMPRAASSPDQTQLNFSLTGDNTGAMLDRLGYVNMVRNGKAKLTGALSWQGPPTSIHYPSLTGKMQLDVASGRFNKMEPGAGRLLGLLSLQFLPRRLTLDFSDIFSEGFAFDSIKGDMDLSSGVLHTKNLEIAGASAQVMMRGSTDLGREVYDLHLTVQPTLSETVAIGVTVGQAAVGVVNPLVGVAAYVAQKLLRDPVEKIFSYEYEISGPWADPKIENTGNVLLKKLPKELQVNISPSVPSSSTPSLPGAKP